MKRYSILLVIVPLCIFSFAGCHIPLLAHQAATPTPTPNVLLPTPGDVVTSQALAGLTFYWTPYALNSWPDARGPYATLPTHDGPRDASGVRITILDGVVYQHPVAQAQDGLWSLVTYAGTHDQAALTLAEKEGQRLINTHTTNAATGDAWWFPYPFDFAEYGDHKDTARAPWYSGMTQGQALCLFTQLYAITNNPQWKDAAAHTFGSFLYPLHSGESPSARPWVWHINGGYAWIEEYPTPGANDHTINGFGFALFGLIAYALQFHDAQATLLAQGGLTTFLKATGMARHPQSVSSYSLSHPKDLSKSYHIIVTQQLLVFAAVTGDKQIAAMAQAFYQDYH